MPQAQDVRDLLAALLANPDYTFHQAHGIAYHVNKRDYQRHMQYYISQYGLPTYVPPSLDLAEINTVYYKPGQGRNRFYDASAYGFFSGSSSSMGSYGGTNATAPVKLHYITPVEYEAKSLFTGHDKFLKFVNKKNKNSLVYDLTTRKGLKDAQKAFLKEAPGNWRDLARSNGWMDSHRSLDGSTLNVKESVHTEYYHTLEEERDKEIDRFNRRIETCGPFANSSASAIV